jgi:hypothetical protein
VAGEVLQERPPGRRLADRVPAAGACLLALVVRGFVARREVLLPDVFTHLGNATLVWITLFHALYDTAPGTLALASIGLAALYLALGLAALRERPEATLQVRTVLGLAAVFLTVAIPVRLGLHGITLAWAAEGVLLLGLGLRYQSNLARAGAYAVLALAALRAAGAAHALGGSADVHARLQPRLRHLAGRDRGPGGGGAALAPRRPSAGPRGVGGLFHRGAVPAVRPAERRDDGRVRPDGAPGPSPRRPAGRGPGPLPRPLRAVAGLDRVRHLVAGRRPGGAQPALCYAGYALFALTAAKVVFVDTATLRAPERILSFLVLGSCCWPAPSSA